MTSSHSGTTITRPCRIVGSSRNMRKAQTSPTEVFSGDSEAGCPPLDVGGGGRIVSTNIFTSIFVAPTIALLEQKALVVPAPKTIAIDNIRSSERSARQGNPFEVQGSGVLDPGLLWKWGR
uniref:Uncharacterized protein n=1 Tax=Eutreptiella gymnastica TaxID=73025 RepID=A0A7S4FG35_9EUGL